MGVAVSSLSGGVITTSTDQWNDTHWWQPYNPGTDDFSKLFEKYRQEITEQMFKPSPLMTALKEKRPKMEEDAVHSAMRKRRAKQAEERIEFLDNEFATISTDDGTIVTWRVLFDNAPSKPYHYLAVRGGARWYVTGDASNYSLDGLITKIVELSMKGQVFFEDADDPL